MQSLVSKKTAPSISKAALKCLIRLRHTKSSAVSSPIVGLDLPDIWSPPSCSRPLLPNHVRIGTNAKVIDGKLIAEEIVSEIADEVCRMKDSIAKAPGLAVIIVGQRKDSQTYVRNKIKACEEVGITSLMTELPEDCAEDEVIRAVSRFNSNPSVHGILVQLPLPKHMDEEKILNAVSLEKDVDGFHPLNMGNLAMSGREPLFIPCTPKGCIELLLRSGIEIMGKKAVVIGRSNIVGTPTSLLLQKLRTQAYHAYPVVLNQGNIHNAKNSRFQFIYFGVYFLALWQRHHATVSVIHAYTRNPAKIACEADIVVSAAGVANLVRGDWLKPGAVVIDVGTNPVEDQSSEHGYRLTGDVCYEEALQVVSAITPVPGGVGPMTIAMLLSNTLDAAKRAFRFS